MSKDLINRPLQPRALMSVAGLFFVVLAGIFWLWWQGQGPFKKPMIHVMPLTGETQIYFVYDDKDTHLAPESTGVEIDGVSADKPIPARKTNGSIGFTSLLVGREPETLPDARTLSDLDTKIRESIKQAIKSKGLQPRELAATTEPASFWSNAPVRPFRLLVHVKKRFEKEKCIFWIDVELQKGAILSADKKQPTYVTILRNDSPAYAGLTEVSPDTAPQAIDQKVSEATTSVLEQGLPSNKKTSPTKMSP